MKNHISIAVDGPAGSGKTTVAGIIANELGIIHLDTGAMYRALGYKALSINIAPDNAPDVEAMLQNTDVQVIFDDDKKQHMLLDGIDVTEKIRTAQVSQAASKIAVVPAVRILLVELQRQVAKEYSVILDGRDTGSYVLPDADVKVYLTASENERARRRLLEMNQKGLDTDKTLEEMIKEISERDYRDSHREFAPLTIAKDATVIDTTGLSIRQVCDRIIEIARK